MIVRIKPSSKTTGWEGGFKSPRFKGAKDMICAYYDRYGSRITGLSISEADELGAKFKQDLSPSSPFWDDYKVIMTSKELVLNTDKPEDLLKYLLLKSHYRVKSSIDDKSKPNADYVIVDELVEANAVNSKAEAKVMAYATFAGLTSDQKAQILRLYKNYTRTDNVDPQIISSKLFTELEKDFEMFNRLATDANRDVKVFLKDLVTAGILSKNRTAYKYGKDVIGHNEEAAVDYLNDPDNQSLKISLMKELKEFNKSK